MTSRCNKERGRQFLACWRGSLVGLLLGIYLVARSWVWIRAGAELDGWLVNQRLGLGRLELEVDQEAGHCSGLLQEIGFATEDRAGSPPSSPHRLAAARSQVRGTVDEDG